MMGSEKDQEKIDEEADKSEKRLKYGAIAAVNAVNSTKQERLIVGENEEAVSNHVLELTIFYNKLWTLLLITIAVISTVVMIGS